MKKTLQTLSVLALSASVLAGCGGGGGNSSASEDYKLENVTLPLKEKVSLHFMSQSSALAPADPNEKLIYKRLEEKSGVHIDFTNYTNDAFIEKRNLAVASGDLPDAIIDAAYSDYDLLTLGKDGTIVPLEEPDREIHAESAEGAGRRAGVQIDDDCAGRAYLCFSMDRGAWAPARRAFIRSTGCRGSIWNG